MNSSVNPNAESLHEQLFGVQAHAQGVRGEQSGDEHRDDPKIVSVMLAAHGMPMAEAQARTAEPRLAPLTRNDRDILYHIIYQHVVQQDMGKGAKWSAMRTAQQMMPSIEYVRWGQAMAVARAVVSAAGAQARDINQALAADGVVALKGAKVASAFAGAHGAGNEIPGINVGSVTMGAAGSCAPVAGAGTDAWTSSAPGDKVRAAVIQDFLNRMDSIPVTPMHVLEYIGYTCNAKTALVGRAALARVANAMLSKAVPDLSSTFAARGMPPFGRWEEMMGYAQHVVFLRSQVPALSVADKLDVALAALPEHLRTFTFPQGRGEGLARMAAQAFPDPGASANPFDSCRPIPGAGVWFTCNEGDKTRALVVENFMQQVQQAQPLDALKYIARTCKGQRAAMGLGELNRVLRELVPYVDMAPMFEQHQLPSIAPFRDYIARLASNPFMLQTMPREKLAGRFDKALCALPISMRSVTFPSASEEAGSFPSAAGAVGSKRTGTVREALRHAMAHSDHEWRREDVANAMAAWLGTKPAYLHDALARHRLPETADRAVWMERLNALPLYMDAPVVADVAGAALPNVGGRIVAEQIAVRMNRDYTDVKNVCDVAAWFAARCGMSAKGLDRESIVAFLREAGVPEQVREHAPVPDSGDARLMFQRVACHMDWPVRPKNVVRAIASLPAHILRSAWLLPGCDARQEICTSD